MPKKAPPKGKGFYWVQSKLVRESGPWYATYVKSPEDVARILKEHLDIENADREHFVAAYLNRKGSLSALEVVSMGGLHSSIVHPREVFKTALLCSAASIILAHNHPSGDSNPSREDIEITNRLIEVGKLLGIEVIDHVIIGVNQFTSLKAKGLM